jgi:hypothetical protein
MGRHERRRRHRDVGSRRRRQVHAQIEFADLYARDPARRRREQHDLVVTTGEPAREIPGERLDAARERRSDRRHVMAQEGEPHATIAALSWSGSTRSLAWDRYRHIARL